MRAIVAGMAMLLAGAALCADTPRAYQTSLAAIQRLLANGGKVSLRITATGPEPAAADEAAAAKAAISAEFANDTRFSVLADDAADATAQLVVTVTEYRAPQPPSAMREVDASLRTAAGVELARDVIWEATGADGSVAVFANGSRVK